MPCPSQLCIRCQIHILLSQHNFSIQKFLFYHGNKIMVSKSVFVGLGLLGTKRNFEDQGRTNDKSLSIYYCGKSRTLSCPSQLCIKLYIYTPKSKYHSSLKPNIEVVFCHGSKMYSIQKCLYEALGHPGQKRSQIESLLAEIWLKG